MNLTDLSPAARLYVLGHARNHRRRADALCEVVFLRVPVRRAARAYGLHAASLQRWCRRLRRDLREAVRVAGLGVFVAAPESPRDRAA